MSKTLTMLLLIVAMAGITYTVRALPLILFKKKIRSVFIKSVLYYIPYAVLSAMTFPYIMYSTGNLYASVIGTAAALIAALFKASLIVVAIIACTVAFLTIIIL